MQPANPQVSDFRSGTRFAAWWILARQGGPQLCAIQGMSFMRHFKRSLLIWPFNTTLNDTVDGTWDATWTVRFFNHLHDEEGWPIDQIPFAVDAPSWNRGMLQAAIWFAYYGHIISLDAVVLPDNIVLPEYGVAPADDGMVGEPTSPACEAITAARAASPNTAAIPVRRMPPMFVPVAVVTLLGAIAAFTLLRKGA